MIKKIILSLLFISLPVFSQEQESPDIVFDDIVPPEYMQCHIAEPDSPQEPCMHSSFQVYNKNLNWSKQSLLDELYDLQKNSLLGSTITQKSLKNHILISIKYIYHDQISNAIYILNNDTVVGYYLISKMTITPFDSVSYTHPIVSQIKNLTHDNSYLANRFNINGITLDFYRKSHSQSNEIYCIATKNNKKSIILEGFYPKELEIPLENIFVGIAKNNFLNNSFLW